MAHAINLKLKVCTWCRELENPPGDDADASRIHQRLRDLSGIVSDTLADLLERAEVTTEITNKAHIEFAAYRSRVVAESPKFGDASCVLELTRPVEKYFDDITATTLLRLYGTLKQCSRRASTLQDALRSSPWYVSCQLALPSLRFTDFPMLFCPQFVSFLRVAEGWHDCLTRNHSTGKQIALKELEESCLEEVVKTDGGLQQFRLADRMMVGDGSQLIIEVLGRARKILKGGHLHMCARPADHAPLQAWLGVALVACGLVILQQLAARKPIGWGEVLLEESRAIHERTGVTARAKQIEELKAEIRSLQEDAQQLEAEIAKCNAQKEKNQKRIRLTTNSASAAYSEQARLSRIIYSLNGDMQVVLHKLRNKKYELERKEVAQTSAEDAAKKEVSRARDDLWLGLSHGISETVHANLTVLTTSMHITGSVEVELNRLLDIADYAFDSFESDRPVELGYRGSSGRLAESLQKLADADPFKSLVRWLLKLIQEGMAVAHNSVGLREKWNRIKQAESLGSGQKIRALLIERGEKLFAAKLDVPCVQEAATDLLEVSDDNIVEALLETEDTSKKISLQVVQTYIHSVVFCMCQLVRLRRTCPPEFISIIDNVREKLDSHEILAVASPTELEETMAELHLHLHTMADALLRLDVFAALSFLGDPVQLSRQLSLKLKDLRPFVPLAHSMTTLADLFCLLKPEITSKLEKDAVTSASAALRALQKISDFSFLSHDDSFLAHMEHVLPEFRDNGNQLLQYLNPVLPATASAFRNAIDGALMEMLQAALRWTCSSFLSKLQLLPRLETRLQDQDLLPQDTAEPDWSLLRLYDLLCYDTVENIFKENGVAKSLLDSWFAESRMIAITLETSLQETGSLLLLLFECYPELSVIDMAQKHRDYWQEGLRLLDTSLADLRDSGNDGELLQKLCDLEEIYVFDEIQRESWEQCRSTYEWNSGSKLAQLCFELDKFAEEFLMAAHELLEFRTHARYEAISRELERVESAFENWKKDEQEEEAKFKSKQEAYDQQRKKLKDALEQAVEVCYKRARHLLKRQDTTGLQLPSADPKDTADETIAQNKVEMTLSSSSGAEELDDQVNLAKREFDIYGSFLETCFESVPYVEIALARFPEYSYVSWREQNDLSHTDYSRYGNAYSVEFKTKEGNPQIDKDNFEDGRVVFWNTEHLPKLDFVVHFKDYNVWRGGYTYSKVSGEVKDVSRNIIERNDGRLRAPFSTGSCLRLKIRWKRGFRLRKPISEGEDVAECSASDLEAAQRKITVCIKATEVPKKRLETRPLSPDEFIRKEGIEEKCLEDKAGLERSVICSTFRKVREEIGRIGELLNESNKEMSAAVEKCEAHGVLDEITKGKTNELFDLPIFRSNIDSMLKQAAKSAPLSACQLKPGDVKDNLRLPINHLITPRMNEAFKQAVEAATDLSPEFGRFGLALHRVAAMALCAQASAVSVPNELKLVKQTMTNFVRHTDHRGSRLRTDVWKHTVQKILKRKQEQLQRLQLAIQMGAPVQTSSKPMVEAIEGVRLDEANAHFAIFEDQGIVDVSSQELTFTFGPIRRQDNLKVPLERFLRIENKAGSMMRCSVRSAKH